MEFDAKNVTQHRQPKNEKTLPLIWDSDLEGLNFFGTK